MNITKLGSLIVYGAMVSFGIAITGNPWVMVAFLGYIFLAAIPEDKYNM